MQKMELLGVRIIPLRLRFPLKISNCKGRCRSILTHRLDWLEALTFVNQSLPAQVVAGHGGTECIKNYVNQDILPFLELHVGPTTADGSPLLTRRD
jgi:hypothetical protein